VPARNWYIIILVVLVVLALAYNFGLFGVISRTPTPAASPPAGTAPPK
jgi:hypothetical protein